MIIIWRRHVLDSLRDRIITSLLEILSGIRKNIVNCAEKRNFQLDDQLFYVVAKAVQEIVDLSVNEFSVHFTNHSKFTTDGVYTILSNKIIENTEQFYDSFKYSSIGSTRYILENDFNIMQRLFLPCTWISIKRSLINILMKHMKLSYSLLYQEFKIEDSDNEPQPLLDTAFSKMLFDSEPSLSAKRKIKVFLKYLIKNNMIEDINYYNKLDLELIDINQDNLIEDEEIEYKTNKIGIQRELSYEENALFSMATDIYDDGFMRILANKTIS